MMSKEKMEEKMKKLLLVVMCIVLLSSSVWSAGAKEESDYTVVLLIVGMQSPYPVPYNANLKMRMEEAGIKYYMFDGKFDPQLQSSQMDDAIAMRPNAIILFPVDSAAISTGIKRAYDAGIPVIMANGEPQEESVKYSTLYFGPNNYEEGKLAGKVATELLKGSGNVVLIEGSTGQDSAVHRTRGFMDAKGSGINVLAAQPADWVKDDAARVMSDLLTSYKGKIDLVFSQSDDMGEGVGIALQEAGFKPEEMFTISLGGTKSGLQFVKDGWITHMIMQSPIDETDQLSKFIIKVVKEGWEAGKQWDPYWNYMDTPVVDKTTYEPFLPGY